MEMRMTRSGVLAAAVAAAGVLAAGVAGAQVKTTSPTYPQMAPMDQYMMPEGAEARWRGRRLRRRFRRSHSLR